MLFPDEMGENDISSRKRDEARRKMEWAEIICVGSLIPSSENEKTDGHPASSEE